MRLGFLNKEKDAETPAVQVGAYGKIPKMGDFARIGARPFASFETWLEGAIVWGEKHQSGAWPTVWATGEPRAFVYRPTAAEQDPTLMAGVIAPSTDAVGRRFPLAVFARLPQQAVAASPHLLPLLLGDFLDAAKGIVTHANVIDGAAGLQRLVGGLAPPDLTTGAVAREYDSWSNGTPLRSAWSSIYGNPRSVTAILTLRAIQQAVLPFVSQENPKTQLGLRLPLGRGGTAGAAFWIDVVRRLVRWRSTIPSFFVACDGRQDALLLELGATPPSALSELWLADSGNEHVYDLMSLREEGRAQALASLPHHLSVKLDREDTLVGELLRLLAS